MRNYRLENKYKLALSSSSVGMQIKYERNGYYYKLDTAGRESLVEYLVTLVLNHSTIRHYVRYEYCRVNDRLSCRSKDFTDGGIFITTENLYEIVTGGVNLSDKLSSLMNATLRYKYLLELYSCIGLNAEMYIKTLLYLDMVIKNTDRHAKNYGVLLKNDRYSFAPIFDNGLSLHTVPDRVCSSTICGDFESQVVATGYPLVSPFKINYTTLKLELDKLDEGIKKTKEYRILCSQLDKYHKIFKL